MAYKFIEEHLADDIRTIDILGATGCRFANERCNLLLEVAYRSFSEDDLILGVQRFRPAGFGADHFMVDIMEIPTEVPLPEQDQLIWDASTTIPPLGYKVWFINVLEDNMIRGSWDLAFRFDAQSTWMIAPEPSKTPSSLRCLELFAGAYGGWKGALSVLNLLQVPSQTLGIEIDERASKAYALTHYASWLGPNANPPKDWFVRNQENWIWQQDVLSNKILQPMSTWQPHVVTISSPCPDWSSAGTAQGLVKSGAKLLFQSILLCRWIRPVYIAIEQVSNFHHHEHKHWILKAMHMVGYRLVWQKVCNLSAHAQTHRLRWLGLAQRVEGNTPDISFDMWPQKEVTWPPITLPFSQESKKQLAIDREIFELASSAAFLKTTVTNLPAADVIFSKRIFRAHEVFPTFMALYGQQHHVRREFLKKHGYLGHFVHDTDMPYNCRFLHPAEVAVLHGTMNKVYLDGDHKHAWHQLGNMIATPHALLLLGNLAKIMGLTEASIEDVFTCFHDNKLNAENCCFKKIGKGGFVMKKDQLITNEFRKHAGTLEKSLHNEQCQVWSPVHGEFKSLEAFQQVQAGTLTKDFVLRPIPRTGMANAVITQSVYRCTDSPSGPSTCTEPSSIPIRSAPEQDMTCHTNALHPAVYIMPASSDCGAAVGEALKPSNHDQHHALLPAVYRASVEHQNKRDSVLQQVRPGPTCSPLPSMTTNLVPSAAMPPTDIPPNAMPHALPRAEYRNEPSHPDQPMPNGTHVPPTRFHAMSLPRLGCGDPSQMWLHEDRPTEVTPTELAVDHRTVPAARPESLTAGHPDSPGHGVSCHGFECKQNEIADTTRPTLGTSKTEGESHGHYPTMHSGESQPPRGKHAADLTNATQIDSSTEATPNGTDETTRLITATHVPPTLFQAIPLPRLGCGGPSQLEDQAHDSGHEHSNRFHQSRQTRPIDGIQEIARKRQCLGHMPPAGDSTCISHEEETAVDHPIAGLYTSQCSGSPEVKTQHAQGDHSPISVLSESVSAPESIPFHPVLKGKIQWKQLDETFWFSADLPAKHIERVWELGPCCQFSDIHEVEAVKIFPLKVPKIDHVTTEVPRDCVQVLLDGELSLMKVQPQVALLQQQQIHALAGTLFDQFGAISEGQTTDFGTILFTEPIYHGLNPHELVYVFAAFTQVTMQWHTCKYTNSIIASFTGEKRVVELVREFFRQAITNHSLTMMGRLPRITNAGEMSFAPSREAGITPPNAFMIAISVAAAKTLFDCLESDNEKDGQQVLIKWAGRPVWSGKLSPDTMLITLECILRHCFAPLAPNVAFRLLSKGAQISLDTKVEQLQVEERHQAVLLQAVMSIRGGGNGTKVQQRAVQQNALASTLLDHGFNLAWTTKTVETIMEKFGLGKLQTVNAQPMGNAKIQAVLTMCKEAGIAIPEPAKPKSGNDIPGSVQQKKKKRTSEFKLNPADYSLVEGFFTREDGSAMPQASQIIPQSCGICMQTPAQAEVWVREGQKISADELGLLVLGSIGVPTGLPSEEITFPCYNNDGQMVLITATLIQVGAKTTQHKQGDPKQVPSETCSLVAVTLYREDWQDEDWRAITSNPTAFVRKQLEAEGLANGIQAVWGKSLRHQRAPATPIQALTVQVHLTVEDGLLERLMARSGFNRLFLTPKTQSGRLNPAYKVIWIPGDIPKMTSMSTKCQACLGLVRGRQGKGYGLRFHMDKHEAAWKVLMPGMTPPQNTPGDKVYKLQNLPFGCTKLMLQNWLEAMQWAACPIRALGPQTWIVRSADDLPPGILMFNSSPILARLLPPREQQTPDKILLGPRPKPSVVPHGDPWHQGQDPWAHYGPAKTIASNSAAPMPPQQGPTEKRLQEQDAKIANIQANLDQLTQAQQHHAKQIDSQLKQAEQREKENMTKMDQALRHIETSVDNAMTKSMHQYQTAMDERFQEIKNLFMSNKRPAPPGASEMTD